MCFWWLFFWRCCLMLFVVLSFLTAWLKWGDCWLEWGMVRVGVGQHPIFRTPSLWTRGAFQVPAKAIPLVLAKRSRHFWRSYAARRSGIWASRAVSVVEDTQAFRTTPTMQTACKTVRRHRIYGLGRRVGLVLPPRSLSEEFGTLVSSIKLIVVPKLRLGNSSASEVLEHVVDCRKPFVSRGSLLCPCFVSMEGAGWGC